MWIMKPVGRAQGKGIFLVNKLSQVSEWKPVCLSAPTALRADEADNSDAVLAVCRVPSGNRVTLMATRANNHQKHMSCRNTLQTL